MIKLKQARIRNYRSLEDVTIRLQDGITVFVGRNDCGKSSVLDALERTFKTIHGNKEQPDESEYFRDPDSDACADVIVIELCFQKGGDEGIEGTEREGGGTRELAVRVTYRRGGEHRIEQRVHAYVVEELNLTDQQLQRKTPPELDALLSKLGFSPSDYPRKSEKLAALAKARESAPRNARWKEVRPAELQSLSLPRFERYRAIDYQQPERIVEKTLARVFATFIGSGDTEAKLSEVQQAAADEIQRAVAQLREHVERYLPGYEFSYDPRFNFGRALEGGEFTIRRGQSWHRLSAMGDGTKRRMLMGVLMWDREIQRQLPANQPILLGYDEPDTNLDYENQRRFFASLRGLARENPAAQVMICTHSVLMIDSAPASSIVLLNLDHGRTKALHLYDEACDEEINAFLSDVASTVGLTNSALLFERAYLIVEGQTEQQALPIMYRKIYGSSMREDGIVLLCVEGHINNIGLWELFRLEWKKNSFIALLDKPAAEEQRNRLLERSWPEEELNARLIPIGMQEFEDAFSDEVWARVLNGTEEWRREDGQPWSPDHIRQIRTNCQDAKRKFSEDLCAEVQRQARCGKIKKPKLGYELACRIEPEEVPQAIRAAFERVRQLAGVSDSS